MPSMPQPVNTTEGSSSLVWVYDHQHADGMSYLASDGKYNWAAALALAGSASTQVRLTCLGSNSIGSAGDANSGGTITITVVNPPSFPMNYDVAVYYVFDS